MIAFIMMLSPSQFVVLRLFLYASALGLLRDVYTKDMCLPGVSVCIRFITENQAAEMSKLAGAPLCFQFISDCVSVMKFGS